MVTQQLLDYIKSAAENGQSREAITQALLQNGWGDRDVQEGLAAILGQTYSALENKESIANTPHFQQQKEINNTNTNYTQDNPTQKVSPRSILPMAIIAGTAVIVVGIAVTFWFLIRGNANSNQVAGKQTVPTKVTTTNQNSQLAQQVEVKTTTSSQIPKSYIDEYGTDLYTLKEGETIKDVGEIPAIATIITDGKEQTELAKTTVIYNRQGDTIKVKVVQIMAKDTSKFYKTLRLNTKENFVRGLNIAKLQVEKECATSVTSDCVQQRSDIKEIEAQCAHLITDRDINNCSGDGLVWTYFDALEEKYNQSQTIANPR